MPQDSATARVLCEVCRSEFAYSFSWFPDPARWFEESSGHWKITGDCTTDREAYYITFPRWIADHAWLKQLRGKRWFDETDFRAAVARVPDPAIQASLRHQQRGRWS